jgi:regulator of ribonuclease activity A
MNQASTDLHDATPSARVLILPLVSFGGIRAFDGPVETVYAPEDNTLVRATLEEPGDGRVLVVDGIGSGRVALLGDNVAQLAVDHGWAGIVVNGCVRDSAELAGMRVGVLALGTCPVKSHKYGWGRRGEPVTFGGVTIRPGDRLVADADGVIVLP